jgi:hypothetical protein
VAAPLRTRGARTPARANDSSIFNVDYIYKLKLKIAVGRTKALIYAEAKYMHVAIVRLCVNLYLFGPTRPLRKHGCL